MSTGHFWSDAPACGWASYIWRSIAGRPTPPSILPTNSTLNPFDDPIHPRLQLDDAVAEDAEEYSQFITKHFYSADTIPVKMRIPKNLIEEKLASGAWVGVCARTHDRRLVGCVFSKYAGFFDAYEAGIVDYLCVSPNHRKMGVADTLLRSLYVSCMRRQQQRAIQFFRREGAFKPIPPISSDLYYGRPILRGLNSYRVEHGTLTKEVWASFLAAKSSTDIILMNYKNEPSELHYAFYGSVHVIYKPTYEYGPDEKDGRCILLDWWSDDKDIPGRVVDDSVLIIVDSLPYNYVYAASSFPTVKSDVWRMEGTIGVYAFHLDPGVPFKRGVWSSVTW